MTDFVNNLKQKIREKTNYDEKTSEKRQLKESLFRKQLQTAQTLIAEDKPLPKRIRFDVIHHLKTHMNSEEMRELNKLKEEYQTTTYKVSAISLINIICSAAFIKDFMNYKWYSKLAISSFVFCSSHYVGMYQMEEKTHQFQNTIINNYKQQFLASNFIKNKLSYDPSRPDPHLQVRENIKKPKLYLEEEAEANQQQN